jgi:FG-GAP repeat
MGGWLLDTTPRCAWLSPAAYCYAAVLIIAAFAVAPDAAGAAYLAATSPFLEQAQLPGNGGGFGGFDDRSVALSADGNAALVGAWNGEPPYALLFTRSGSAWSQAASLVPEYDGGGIPRTFGASVALSGDGTIALVGAPEAKGEYGVVWAFTREGGTWHSVPIEPTAASEGGPARFGWSVAISADGNTAIVGAPQGSPREIDGSAFDGSAFIFSRSGNKWIEQAGPLHGAERINPFGNNDGFASTVAMSGDGNTAIVGAPGESGGQGGAWVYHRSGSTWSQDGPRLNPAGERGTPHFGESVALSGDGTRALIGSGAENNEGGTAWVFGRATGGWASQTRFTPGYSGALWGGFGWTVALSSSGNTGLIAGWDVSPEEAGRAWAVRCTASGWIQEPIGPPSASASENFGYSVSLSGNGATALISAPGVEKNKAAAFVFSGPPDSPGSCAGSPQPGPGGSTQQRGVGTTPGPPFIYSVRETNRVWREGNKLARVAKRKLPVGTTFSFTVNQQARISFAFARPVVGRRVNGRCVARTTKNRRRHACRRAVNRGTTAFAGRFGKNKVSFEGRISRSKKLPRGTYTLTITAANSVGQRSSPKQLTFTIVR